MTKRERVDTVLRGEAPDRPPLSLWYHFGCQFLPGEKFAELAVAYFDYFDFDWLKVMNDYFYPMPPGKMELRSKEDLKLIRPFDIEKSPWNQQLKALRYIRNALKGKAYFCDTVFDPYQVLQRSPVGEHLPRLMEEEPEALLAALEVVTENVIEYAKKALDCGAAGIFFSVLASNEQLGRENFLKFEKPFAMKVFEAVRDRGIMNIAHIHGQKIYTDHVLDFPVPILSWEDRLPGNPSLAEVKERFPGCVMAGIDRTIMTRNTPARIAENTRQGIQMGGKSRFFLANGCSIPGHMDPEAIKAIVATTRSAGR